MGDIRWGKKSPLSELFPDAIAKDRAPVAGENHGPGNLRQEVLKLNRTRRKRLAHGPIRNVVERRIHLLFPGIEQGADRTADKTQP